MICVTSDMHDVDAKIVPEPAEAEREAILHALAADEPRAGWAEAALAEGVSADGSDPFQQHDVCSLW